MGQYGKALIQEQLHLSPTFVEAQQLLLHGHDCLEDFVLIRASINFTLDPFLSLR